MTPPEYIQMKAFARSDGMSLFLLWLASFICYVLGLRSSILSLVAIILALTTPFKMLRRLRAYRDNVLEGFISFRRGWAYTVFVFFYAGLLFALAQFVYFAYLDHGYFFSTFNEMMNNAETGVLGIDGVVQAIQQMSQMRPIDLALNILTSNLFVGCVLGLLLAANVKRNRLEKIENKENK
jgi:hypothetical protein